MGCHQHWALLWAVARFGEARGRLDGTRPPPCCWGDVSPNAE